MESLDFLYYALGIGFLVLVVFICMSLFYLAIILRDFTIVSKNAKDVSDRVRKYVYEPLETLAEVSSIFAVIQQVLESLAAKFQEAAAEDDEDVASDDVDFEVKGMR